MPSLFDRGFEQEPVYRINIPPILEDAAYVRDWMSTMPSIASPLAEALTDMPDPGLISAAASVLRSIEEAHDIAVAASLDEANEPKFRTKILRPSIVARIEDIDRDNDDVFGDYVKAIKYLGFEPAPPIQDNPEAPEAVEEEYESVYFAGPDLKVVITKFLQGGKDLTFFAEARLVRA